MGALLSQGCLVTPGTFESSLDIRADRSFTFADKGEVIASDMGKGMSQDSDPADAVPQGEELSSAILWQEDAAPAAQSFAQRDESDDARMQHVAAALMKEKGFRSARYLGNLKFAIDYALSGTLTHAFQDQEDGPTRVAQGRRIVWKANPMTSEAPMAVPRFRP